MGLHIIAETMDYVSKKLLFSDEEKEFVVEFAFKTNDTAMTNKLIDELSDPDRDFSKIKSKYKDLYDKRPNWISQIENLLVSLQKYRIEEEKAIDRITEILTTYGIDITVEALCATNIKEVREKLSYK